MTHTFGGSRRNRLTRVQVFLRHAGRCLYCNMRLAELRDLSVDHFIASANGGQNKVANFVCACLRCNHAKNDLDGDVYLKWVRRDINSGKVWPWPAEHSAALTEKMLCTIWGKVERGEMDIEAPRRAEALDAHSDARGVFAAVR